MTTKAPATIPCPEWCSRIHDLRVNMTADYEGDVIHESAPLSVQADRGGHSENRPVSVSAERYPEGDATETRAVVGVDGAFLYFSPAATRDLITALTLTLDQMETSR